MEDITIISLPALCLKAGCPLPLEGSFYISMYIAGLEDETQLQLGSFSFRNASVSLAPSKAAAYSTSGLPSLPPGLVGSGARREPFDKSTATSCLCLGYICMGMLKITDHAFIPTQSRLRMISGIKMWSKVSMTVRI